ncbi:MAG: hypothetical protein U0795_22505 [Pirellulales bacterium]
MSPIFLTLDDVLESHAHQIAAYGGVDGIHDLGLLESAVLQPSAMFGGSYLHTDLFEMAAAGRPFISRCFRCLHGSRNLLTDSAEEANS